MSGRTRGASRRSKCLQAHTSSSIRPKGVVTVTTTALRSVSDSFECLASHDSGDNPAECVQCHRGGSPGSGFSEGPASVASQGFWGHMPRRPCSITLGCQSQRPLLVLTPRTLKKDIEASAAARAARLGLHGRAEGAPVFTLCAQRSFPSWSRHMFKCAEFNSR